jgi:hypothetical protein
MMAKILEAQSSLSFCLCKSMRKELVKAELLIFVKPSAADRCNDRGEGARHLCLRNKILGREKGVEKEKRGNMVVRYLCGVIMSMI